jgi:predicted transcriptional regulator
MPTDTSLNVHIGSLEDMGARFAAAMARGQNRQALPPRQYHIPDAGGLHSPLSPRRLELMRHLRRNGPMSVRRLSQELSRDYKSVHREVAMLTASGLVDRRAADEVAVAWDRVVTELDLAATSNAD